MGRLDTGSFGVVKLFTPRLNQLASKRLAQTITKRCRIETTNRLKVKRVILKVGLKRHRLYLKQCLKIKNVGYWRL